MFPFPIYAAWIFHAWIFSMRNGIRPNLNWDNLNCNKISLLPMKFFSNLTTLRHLHTHKCWWLWWHWGSTTCLGQESPTFYFSIIVEIVLYPHINLCAQSQIYARILAKANKPIAVLYLSPNVSELVIS